LEEAGFRYYIQVKEPLAISVINTVLGIWFQSPNELFISHLFVNLKKHGSASDTSKGKVWEYLVLANMLRYNGLNVDEIVNMFYKDQVFRKGNGESLEKAQLPEWTKSAIFNVKSYGNAEMFCLQCCQQGVYKDDVDIIQQLLALSDS